MLLFKENLKYLLLINNCLVNKIMSKLKNIIFFTINVKESVACF